MRRTILVTMLVVIMGGLSKGQSVRSAEKAWQNRCYRQAVEEYQALHRKKPGDTYYIQRLGTLNRLIGNFSEAEKWFRLLFEKNPSANPDYALQLAQVLAINGHYAESGEWYGIYDSLQHDDRRGRLFKTAYQNIGQFFRDSSQWEISYLSLNTPADEYAPLHLGDGLLFTSNRITPGMSQNFSKVDNEPFTDIFFLPSTSELKKVPVEELSRELGRTRSGNLSGGDFQPDLTDPRYSSSANLYFPGATPVVRLGSGINTSYHDGNTTSDAEGKTIFLNTNNRRDNREGIHLALKSVQHAGGKFGPATDFRHNDSRYNFAHPALSPDGKVIYFVSDMPGGKGGFDIYFCLRNEEGWSRPINLGPLVNTAANEVFPYVDSNNNLYFSSTGHPGLGGLDIFVVGLAGNKPQTPPKNMGYPVNSRSDDFGITIRPDAYSGYFSSNRFGSDDILHFRYR